MRGSRPRPRTGRRTDPRRPCDLAAQPLPRACDRAPAVLVTSAGEAADAFTLAPVDAVGVAAALEADRAPRPCARTPGAARPTGPSARLLGRIGTVDPTSLDAYQASGGYARPGARDRDRPGGGHRGGHRREADGARRCGVPDRSQVGRRRGPARRSPLPRLQRRRVRARDVQGPRAARGRPVRDRRGDDHRGLRHRRLEGLPLHPRRVPRGRGARERGASRRPARPASSGRTSSARASPSTSSCGAAPAPTSAARRRPSSNRSRASAASHATSRRSRSRSGCSASRPSSTTSRRWPTCR